MSNHLGNVLVTVSDRKLESTSDNQTVAYYTADVASATDYYPFGMSMPGRKYASDRYRYGFNGKENDAETSTQDYGFRIYNPALGKFLSVDPLQAKFAEIGTYSFVGNNPIFFLDPDGKDIKPTKTFMTSAYASVYNNLIKGNSVYSSMLAKYRTSNKFNFYLKFTDIGVSPGSNATTVMSSTTAQQKKGNTVTKWRNSVEANSLYGVSPMTKSKEVEEDGTTFVVTLGKTDIYLAKTLLHESIHGYMRTTMTEEDDNHDNFSKYQGALLKGLREYNLENKLGYTENQLTQLSWVGVQESSAFKAYIETLATANGTAYEEEYKKWNSAQDALAWKELKKERKLKKASSSDSSKQSMGVPKL